MIGPPDRQHVPCNTDQIVSVPHLKPDLFHY
jgi:hypothetical protein